MNKIKSRCQIKSTKKSLHKMLKTLNALIARAQ